jgi:hypothetical protein
MLSERNASKVQFDTRKPLVSLQRKPLVSLDHHFILISGRNASKVWILQFDVSLRESPCFTSEKAPSFT